MKIAVLSGKGGTGKTLVSVNLAAAAQKALYLDCDVEAPNGHLFFKPEAAASEAVTVKIPVVDPEKCTGCRQCVDFCKFNALAYIHNKVMVFGDICHSCGGCVLVCPERAIVETNKTIGRLESGRSGDVRVVSGFLNPGQASGVPVIKEVLKRADAEPEDALTVIDCPPGSACVVMESIQEADYCVLVAEPTVFGAHNLAMVHELVRLFNKPHSVVLNKCLEGSANPSEQFSEAHGVKILGKIPFDFEIGALNSDGKILFNTHEATRTIFSQLLVNLKEAVRNETAPGPQR